MTSGVPDRLPVIYIKNLDDNIVNTVGKFPDYGNIGDVVGSKEGYLRLE